eukprot:TRINITY_DN4080_c0_g1_i2.p1 TRINITY_DN4080_c0_g1~~TRINITY_DN4080_c0_g1_i2.p1  ORF type:complete len:251 (-),score=47.49 TRINITY_DN4080_c0_g1_i2:92-844(-)
MNDTYGDVLGYHCEKVVLYTSLRKDGKRFSPMVIYLGFKYRNDTSPSFYVMEAGDTMGGIHMSQIGNINEEYWDYARSKTTPWSSHLNVNLGSVEVDGSDPSVAQIICHQLGEIPYMTITMRFRKLPIGSDLWEKVLPPDTLQRISVYRIFSIIEGMDGIGDIEPNKGFAERGDQLEWLIHPRSKVVLSKGYKLKREKVKPFHDWMKQLEVPPTDPSDLTSISTNFSDIHEIQKRYTKPTKSHKKKTQKI